MTNGPHFESINNVYKVSSDFQINICKRDFRFCMCLCYKLRGTEGDSGDGGDGGDGRLFLLLPHGA
jgi:hypothetical protein